MSFYLSIAIVELVVAVIIYVASIYLFKLKKSYGLLVVIFTLCIVSGTIFARGGIYYETVMLSIDNQSKMIGRELTFDEARYVEDSIINNKAFSTALTAQGLYATVKTSVVVFLLIYLMAKPDRNTD